ncbi:hypothetical protein Tco_0755635, partial [Tanacetum coccineum]
MVECGSAWIMGLNQNLPTGIPNPQHILPELLAIEGRKQTFRFHFNTSSNIGAIDFTLDDVLDEYADVGETIESAKCITG